MYIADLHIHSKFSRATSKEGIPEYLDLWARRKGIGLVGTGDFTHPAWREMLRERLTPAEEGLYTLKKDFRVEDGSVEEALLPRFVVSGEISSIYKKNGKVRKIHNVILLPGIDEAETVSKRLEAIGNLHSDGRPILGLDSRDLFEIVLTCCPSAILIPAHIWTPHFSLFGAFSGFDTIEECFEDMTPYIHALETGLSSDPPMNWRLSALDSYTLVSNSDAHSPQKLGREANCIQGELSYSGLKTAIETGEGFQGTIEFFPEEGKYHLDGHRNCHQCLTPSEAIRAGGVCPVCGKKLTIGVLHRVEELADRPEGAHRANSKPYESLVPLPEVIGASLGVSAASKKAGERFSSLLRELGPEFHILREASLSDIDLAAGPCVAEGVRRVREGKVKWVPGYDGEYGKLEILSPEEIRFFSGQLSFFPGAGLPGEKAEEKPEAAKPDFPEEEDPLQLTLETLPKAEVSAETAGDCRALLGLNPEQKEAVTTELPAAAVIAGPGTGKTKTLTSRIAYLIEARKAKPSEITAVTFTRKAAEEMRLRLQALLGKRVARAIQIGTFHSVCMKLLASEKDAETGVLLDEYGCLSLAEEVLREYEPAPSEKKPGARSLLQKVSAVKNSADRQAALEEEGLSEALFTSYCGALRSYGAMDYDDILLDALSLARERQKPIKAFTYLLVDEFQDVNPVQYELLRAWNRAGREIFVIGDPDQAIYGFRGSDSLCFSRFREDFSGAGEIRLRKNYRSTPEILACALPVIAENHKDGSLPALEAFQKSGSLPGLYSASDEFSEAVFIAKEINRMVGGIDMLDAHSSLGGGDHPRGFSDIAILYRTHRQAELLEKCLAIEGIPYTVTGRDRLLAEPIVRGTLGFFRSLLHPEDRVSLKTCLQSVWGCSEKLSWETSGAFAKAACGTQPRACEDQPVSGMEGFLENLPCELRAEGGVRVWAALALSYLPRLSESPRELLETWAEENGYTGSSPMERLLSIAVLHQSLPDFLDTVTLGTEGDVSRSSGQTYTPDAVSLMTLHGSKGLEFPVVFLCGLQKGRLPLESPGRKTDAAEERRLFYVGITRAREELILTAPPEPSPFLEDIPKTLLSQITGPEKRRSAYEETMDQISLF